MLSLLDEPGEFHNEEYISRATICFVFQEYGQEISYNMLFLLGLFLGFFQGMQFVY